MIGSGTPHQHDLKNNEMKKQGDGEDADADQRHVREIIKDLALGQANHATTPCNTDKKKEDNANN